MSPRQPAADLVVVGAGVMGAWTAYHGAESGRRTTLIDAYGVGHPRATSGDETRITRASHGVDPLYSRWAREALVEWRRLGQELDETLFVQAGALWFAGREDGFEVASHETLSTLGIPVERLTADEVRRRWPQVAIADDEFAVFEPEAGLLYARRGVQAVARAFATRGGRFELAVAQPGRVAKGRLVDVVTTDGDRHAAETFVFACGPWLPRLFPEVLGRLIRVTKQDVFFIGPPAGDGRFAAEWLPCWVDYDAAFYGIPAADGRGFKLAPDRYGPLFDPSRGQRIVDPDSTRLASDYLARRFPALAGQPIVETRVCQYETTPDTQFLIDRHPDLENVWLVGGGSGHGFKHGPKIGAHVVGRLEGAAATTDDERFAIDRTPGSMQGMRTGGDGMAATWEGY